jgi:hypothetical protein
MPIQHAREITRENILMLAIVCVCVCARARVCVRACVCVCVCARTLAIKTTMIAWSGGTWQSSDPYSTCGIVINFLAWNTCSLSCALCSVFACLYFVHWFYWVCVLNMSCFIACLSVLVMFSLTFVLQCCVSSSRIALVFRSLLYIISPDYFLVIYLFLDRSTRNSISDTSRYGDYWL